jgi:hypothetical protein
MGVVVIAHTINNHNHYLILCISNCNKRKKLQMNLFLYNFIFNTYPNFFYYQSNEFRNTQNHFLCYVTSAFK